MRQAYRLLGVSLSSFYFQPRPTRNILLVERVQQIAKKHPRYGERRAHALLRRDLVVNHKRVHRLWKQEGLGLKRRSRRRRRGIGTMPLAALYPGHVWTYDVVHDAGMHGRKLKLLTIVDEYTREALAIEVAGSRSSREVTTVLSRLFRQYGAPKFLRSDNGPEFLAKLLCTWLTTQGTSTLYIDPGSPWQNRKGERFNGRFRHAWLNAALFRNVTEAKICIEQWWQQGQY